VCQWGRTESDLSPTLLVHSWLLPPISACCKMPLLRINLAFMSLACLPLSGHRQTPVHGGPDPHRQHDDSACWRKSAKKDCLLSVHCADAARSPDTIDDVPQRHMRMWLQRLVGLPNLVCRAHNSTSAP
jgi:hypothetical protein